MKKRHYLLEGLLIVFSVLLAFFLNEMRINSKEKTETNTMLTNLKSEIERNKDITVRWSEYHDQVKQKIRRAKQADTIAQALSKDKLFTTDKIAPKGLIQETISDIAWDIAKENKISSKVSYETSVALFKSYEQQDLINNTMQHIISIYNDRNTQDLDKIETTGMLLYNSFNELVGQEIRQLQLYDKVLEIID